MSVEKLLLLLLFLGGSACSHGKSSNKPQPAYDINSFFVSPLNLKIVKTADAVSVCKITKSDSPDVSSLDSSTIEYIEENNVALTVEQAREISLILNDSGMYRWPARLQEGGALSVNRTACHPVFHIRMSFFKGTSKVAFDFCFSCKIVTMACEGSKLSYSFLNLDRPELMGFLIKFFPQDQTLKRRVELNARKEKLEGL